MSATSGRRGRNRSAATRAAPFRVRPAAVVVIAVVLAAFITGLVLGGVTGGLIIGLLAVTAGVLLVLRWQAVDPRIRLFRLGAVLLTLAIAVTVFVRR